MTFLASASSETHPAAGLVLLVLAIIFIAPFLMEPDKNKTQKWLYWFAVPISMTIIVAVALKSVVAALVLGFSEWILLLAINFRKNW